MPFENDAHMTRHANCFLLKLKDYSFLIVGKITFDQTIKGDIKTYEDIRKIVTCQEDDYITRWLLDCPCFKENYKMISIDLIKQAFDFDPKEVEVYSIANLDQARKTLMFFIFKGVKENYFVFLTRICKSIVNSKYLV